MGAALKFKTTDVPRQAAELSRLKIIDGPDLGAIFVISGSRVSIGRGEENDIVIADLKASRKHAEFALANRQWSVRDLGSANGIFVNGKNTRASLINTGDTVTFGETTVEFVSAEAGTQMLKALPRSIEEVQMERAAYVARQQNVRQLARISASPSGASDFNLGNGNKNSRLPLLIGAAGIIAFVIFGNNDTRVPPVIQKAQDKGLASYLPQSDEHMSKSADVFFREGFREYRESNYLRARTQFETALQISPGNPLATLYLENCNKAIDDDVKSELGNAKKAYESGNLKDAKLHYESVMRLLYRDQSNSSFIEARDQLDVVKKEMEEDR